MKNKLSDSEVIEDLKVKRKEVYSGVRGRELKELANSISPLGQFWLFRWIPEQAEDIYYALSPEGVLEIEISRIDNGIAVKKIDADLYSKTIKDIDNIRIFNLAMVMLNNPL